MGDSVRETFSHQNIHPKCTPDSKKKTKLPENGKPRHYTMLPDSVMSLILRVPALTQCQQKYGNIKKYRHIIPRVITSFRSRSPKKTIHIQPEILPELRNKGLCLLIQFSGIIGNLSHNDFIDLFINSKIIIIEQNLLTFTDSDTVIKLFVFLIRRYFLEVIKLRTVIKQCGEGSPLFASIGNPVRSLANQ